MRRGTRDTCLPPARDSRVRGTGTAPALPAEDFPARGERDGMLPFSPPGKTAHLLRKGLTPGHRAPEKAPAAPPPEIRGNPAQRKAAPRSIPRRPQAPSLKAGASVRGCRQLPRSPWDGIQPEPGTPLPFFRLTAGPLQGKRRLSRRIPHRARPRAPGARSAQP